MPSPVEAFQLPAHLANVPLLLHVKWLNGNLLQLNATSDWTLDQVKHAAASFTTQEAEAAAVSEDPHTNFSRGRFRLLTLSAIADSSQDDNSPVDGPLESNDDWKRLVHQHIGNRREEEEAEPLQLAAFFRSPPPTVMLGTPCQIYHRKLDKMLFQRPALEDGTLTVHMPGGYHLYFTSCRMCARTSEFQPLLRHLGALVAEQQSLSEITFRTLIFRCAEGPVRVEDTVLIQLMEALGTMELECISLASLVVSYSDSLAQKLMALPTDRLREMILPRPLLEYDVDGVVEWNETHLCCMRNYHRVMMHFYRALSSEQPSMTLTTISQVDLNTFAFKNVTKQTVRVQLTGHLMFSAEQAAFLPFTYFSEDEWRALDDAEVQQAVAESRPRKYGPQVKLHAFRQQMKETGCNWKV